LAAQQARDSGRLRDPKRMTDGELRQALIDSGLLNKEKREEEEKRHAELSSLTAALADSCKNR
jgi:hypothetical protein